MVDGRFDYRLSTIDYRLSMTFTQAILIVLQSLPVHYTDKSEARRDERLKTIASAIADASSWVVDHHYYNDKVELAGALLQKGEIETGFAEHVHSGQCRPHECDFRWSMVNGRWSKDKEPRAVGLWQTHKLKDWSIEYWHSLKGTSYEATYETARVTAIRIAGGVGKCGSLAGSFELYNSGHNCNGRKFEASAHVALSLANKIRIYLQKSTIDYRLSTIDSGRKPITENR